MSNWASLANNIAGTYYLPTAVLTFAGTWAAPGTGYPTNVVDGLTQFVNPNLCYEVPVIAPWSFGILGPGGPTADSYDQSVSVAVEFAGNWMSDNPDAPFVLGGYSQGAEAASRVLIELQSGSLAQHMPNFRGGYTFGNPCRKAHAIASGVTDPGNYRGISSVNITELPTIGGQVVWADYLHSPANGDAALDMYGAVPVGNVGDLMTQWYTAATVGDINSLSDFTSFIVDSLTAIESDLNDIPGALQAAEQGIAFLMAPGGPTAPHVSYLSEIQGYGNQVAQAVGFLNRIASASPNALDLSL